MSTNITVNSNFTNSSLYSTQYTYHWSKYSCLVEFYFIHVVFCYLLVISGTFALITRLHPKLHPAHKYFGIGYVAFMLLTTASSLLIHNTGLPLGVLISFGICIGGLVVGWILIKFHQYFLMRTAFAKMDDNGKNPEENNSESYVRYKASVMAERSFVQKVFSTKSLHGMFMFMSYINVLGRIFASDQSGDFTCYTYLVWKPIESPYGPPSHMDLVGKPPQLVPVEDPNYSRLPWANWEGGWGAALSLGPFFAGMLFAVIWVAVDSAIQMRKNN